ncbi:hydroxyacid dehydrogenase [Paenibacillus glycanilyticus]|uniref:2-hydroxyacid dehydrogenase n=1 Tax=Paenibacillus glycanilyticus TaxID=126569 RepID=A0ABQ6GDQ6_9BACL|nr:hydroxyacid dehydrogenase [Paenibacillus glycanilyticus]GLX67787.1 2-hydroxyacid dehydrogenase [Paenibacillus glycanilyticus]
MKTLLAISDPDLIQMFFQNPAVLKKLGTVSEYHWIKEMTPLSGSAGLAAVVEDYDAVLTSWGSPFFTDEVLAKASKLKFIGHLAGSATAIVNEQAFAKDMVVVTANNVLARSTAESAVALMMSAAWSLQPYSMRMKRGGWANNSKETVLGLTGRTIGLIGYGEISRNVIGLLRGFPVQIKLASRYCSEEEARELGVQLCSLDELLTTSEIISLHSSLTPSTVGMIGRRELSLIQDGALFVNTARARIVDEESLMNELRTGRFSAALDVFHQEPVPVNHELHEMEHVLCTPHIGGFAGQCKRAFGDYIIDQLIACIRGEEPDGNVTLEQFNRMTSNALA